MARSRSQIVQRFQATDALGHVYDVVVWQEYIDTTSNMGPSEIKGKKDLRLTDGRHLNYTSKGQYLLVETNTVLVSEDPNAP